MEGFRERLAGHAVLGLDTNVFIYQFEAHPRYLPLTRELLSGVEHGKWTAVTSVLTVMELTVRPWQMDRPGVAREYEALLVHFPHLTLADVTRDVARRAAQLRARYRLRSADALQAATALLHEATVFVTNDRELARLASVMDVIVLEEWIA
jgi:predicted nucleic acid-binding protein